MADPSVATEDDADLARRIISRAPARDRSAEADLCRRLGPRIRLYGLRHLRDPAAAADLAQDVLILLLQKLREGQLRDPDRLASFVLGMARQRIVDGRRNERRRARLLEAWALDLAPACEETALPPDLARLASCLHGLPERERAVLVMTFYGDRQAEEVGAELGLTAGNIRVIRHRGLVHLRGCMQAAGGGADA